MFKDILSKYEDLTSTSELSSFLSNQDENLFRIDGISGSQSAFIGSALFNISEKSMLAVFPDKEEAAYFYNDVQQLIEESKVFFLPASSQRLTKGDIQNINSLDRTLVLKALEKTNQPIVIVTHTEALIELMPKSSEFKKQSMTLSVWEELSMDELIDHFNEIKFERTDFVYQPGQFSWRGGIVDVFSFDTDKPYRLEFSGDQIESIRQFDIESQLSVKDKKRISITPDSNKTKTAHQVSIIENLSKNHFVFARDLALVIDKVKEIDEKAESSSSDEKLLPHLSAEDLTQQLEDIKLIEFGQFQKFNGQKSIQLSGSPQPAFNKNFELLADNLRSFDKKEYTTYITASDSNQVNRFYEIFDDIGKDVNIHPIISSLHEGFIDNDLKLLCYTDHQVFGRYHKFRLRESFESKSQSISLKELMGLQAGDYITHIDHGVGKYSGLEKIDVNGKTQEAIRIIYKNNDVLYISIHSLHRISKYVGKDGVDPKMDKLGSNAWKTLKQKTKTRVKELAFDLIKLYAERKSKKGFGFSPDSYLQTELEASFIYEDTPDQFKATQDVKSDMEQEHPMDRLVCGDVGFGKTEIAIRAAFKAVNDSKQVAVLVPTTILAMQHYKTFKSRLEEFPCKIDYLNRFRTAKDQRRILEEVESGKIDIIIGTHKLLSDKLKFKDLGLMIIDEEQKFGVGAKDKLKTIKVNVDTLTLTATPIPRTLQFSMMGARDLSIINTAPPNRLPIETHLYEFNENVIREAIDYEISRGGQVFFINNRVQNIGEIAAMIERLCPDAKVLTAHGQLKGHELEERMLAFIEGEYDVLVSTTIVESGLDISNANTIIINQANYFGLSDLHQMRGRVGRSNRKAFCYLLSPPISSLTPHARKRLKAIEQFSDLGSGFQIAMRDLDIRGAGDIFGAEQSGFISEMGFDMYQKILQEAIQELKENEFKDVFKDEIHSSFVKDCQIETDLEILIPDDYVSNIGERLSLYRELDDIDDEVNLEMFSRSMEDRFGAIPKPVSALMETIKLRWMAKSLGIEKVVLKKEILICYFISNPDSAFYQSQIFKDILNFIQQNPGRCKMTEKNERLSLRFNDIVGIHMALDVLSSMIQVTA